MQSKKYLCILLVLCLLLISFVSAETRPNQLNGFVSFQEEGNLYVLADLIDIELNESGDSINISFNYNNNLVDISAYESKIDKINSLIYYDGKAAMGQKEYHTSLVSNEYGASGLIYNDDRSITIPFSISKNGSMKEKAKEYNKNVSKFKKENKWKEPNLRFEFHNDISNSSNIIMRSTLYNKSVRIINDGVSVPFLLSSGSVDGTLYYMTGTQIQIENPNARFYADRIVGVVNWNTGFDIISIINPNEPYGYLYTTPGYPSRTITTWNINEYACYSDTYELLGQISYTALVQNAPVLFTNRKVVTIN